MHLSSRVKLQVVCVFEALTMKHSQDKDSLGPVAPQSVSSDIFFSRFVHRNVFYLIM